MKRNVSPSPKARWRFCQVPAGIEHGKGVVDIRNKWNATSISYFPWSFDIPSHYHGHRFPFPWQLLFHLSSSGTSPAFPAIRPLYDAKSVSNPLSLQYVRASHLGITILYTLAWILLSSFILLLFLFLFLTQSARYQPDTDIQEHFRYNVHTSQTSKVPVQKLTQSKILTIVLMLSENIELLR